MQTYFRTRKYLDFVVDNVGKSDTAGEPLFGIVISETDLQFHGFEEFSFLSVGKHLIDGLLQEFRVDLGHLNNVW